MSDQPAYTALVAALSSKVPAAVVVPADAQAFFSNSIDAGDALAVGAGIESVTILDEVLRVGGIAVESVVAGKVSGYGPLRMRYCLNLAADLAGKVAELDTSRVEAAGAGTAKKSSLRDSRSLRSRAIRVLKSLAGRRPEEKARLAKASKDEEKADQRSRSLEALAQELKDAMAKVPALVAADAGATPELIDALLSASGSVLGTRGSAQEARTTVASLYDEMNLLDGRLHHELRLLVGAMKDARREDKTIPAVKSSLFRSGNRKNAVEGSGGGGGGGTGGGGAGGGGTGGGGATGPAGGTG